MTKPSNIKGNDADDKLNYINHSKTR